MGLYDNWLEKAYQSDGTTSGEHWAKYLPMEQKIYEEILRDKITKIEGTLSEIAVRFNMTEEFVCGFVDGIREALTEPVTPSEELEPDTALTLNIEFERLYKKMVEYKAEHLYTLPEWDDVIPEERRKELYTEQKKSTTIVKGPQPGRNDPCPCGSGKKYKKCCGA